MWIALSIILVLVIGLYLYPPFGVMRRHQYEVEQFDGKAFRNQIPTKLHIDVKSLLKMSVAFAKGVPNDKPKQPLPMVEPQFTDGTKPTVTWFGHSAFILEIEQLRLFVDPMLGKAPNPFPLRNGRYSKQLPISVAHLPQLDAVVFSHDHYDHLDYGTVQQLKDRVPLFIVPLGVGAHLRKWGVAAEKIREFNWGDEFQLRDVTLYCLPARHFSGRFMNDRNATLWCSWVFESANYRLFFSGDSGYGPHFKEIGARFGSFDFALLECGQYNERWSDIHMMPEETVQAAQDVGAKLAMPIHWGGFTLSLHAWDEPIRRATAEAEKRKQPLATPRIGETYVIGYETTKWWEDVSHGTK